MNEKAWAAGPLVCAIIHQHTKHIAQAQAEDVAAVAVAVREEALAPRDGEPVVARVGEAGDGHVACPHG